MHLGNASKFGSSVARTIVGSPVVVL